MASDIHDRLVSRAAFSKLGDERVSRIVESLIHNRDPARGSNRSSASRSAEPDRDEAQAMRLLITRQIQSARERDDTPQLSLAFRRYRLQNLRVAPAAGVPRQARRLA